jgi:outer membrane lipoprotein-sorting protein
LGFVSSCARARITLPSDTGVPLPDFRAIQMQAAAACTGVRTLTAEIGISGRAGRQRLRGRVVAGFARPASMRLEGVPPFGAPIFILVARGENATLVLPRDEPRVLRGAKPEDILGALTGVALAPADLQAILTGCVAPMPQAMDGRRHANGWASIDLAGGATIYLEPARGGWTLRAARRAGWQIEYPSWNGNFPQSVRLQSTQPNVNVDLTAALSQIETNKDLEDAAFNVNVPPGADTITLDELRDAGPLGS